MNEPDIMPFATAAGKMTCANLVNGVSRTKKRRGGMTSRKRSMGR